MAKQEIPIEPVQIDPVAPQEGAGEVLEPVAAITQADIDKVLQSNSQAVSDALEQYIAAEVQKRLAGVAPKKAPAVTGAVEIANFKKMTYKEKIGLFQTDPEKYNRLTGGNN